jgi:hypothetical protein
MGNSGKNANLQGANAVTTNVGKHSGTSANSNESKNIALSNKIEMDCLEF